VSEQNLDDPTPCAKWTVKDVVNHLVGVPIFFGLAVKGETPGDAPDFASGDFVKSFDEGSAMCVQAFEAPGVLDETFDVPIGKFPGSVCLSIATTDMFVHGWDLARATGQPTDLDPKLAEELLENARTSLPAEYRNEEGNPFGLEKTAPAGSSAADRLAAFMGRDV
jgi:uncharacterized protein (TIGR03086 family)